MPHPSPVSPAPSRREQNKAATRAAIAAAALDLLRAEGAASLTADRLAEAAGVSRRTFFNYFPSVEAAFNVPTETFLDQALVRLDALPEGTPVVAAAVEAMRTLADRASLATVAEVFVLAADNPQLLRLQLEAWDRCAEQLLHTIGQRVPSAPGLDLAVFVYSVIGAGKAAFRHWAETHGGDLSDASLGALQDNLISALEQLRDGFPTLQTSNGAAPDGTTAATDQGSAARPAPTDTSRKA